MAGYEELQASGGKEDHTPPTQRYDNAGIADAVASMDFYNKTFAYDKDLNSYMNKLKKRN